VVCVLGGCIALSGGRLCLQLSRVVPLGGWEPVAEAPAALCFAGILLRWCLFLLVAMVIVAEWGRGRRCDVSIVLGQE